MVSVSTHHGSLSFDKSPNTCPHCHNDITPNIIYGHRYNIYDLDIFFSCPNQECSKSFVALYDYSSSRNRYCFTGQLSFGRIKTRKFSETIYAISQQFTKIYNEAFNAEQNGLKEICGVGYRKALEFLIKDYAISINQEERNKIERSTLSQVIENYISFDNIKSVSKRAVWLGNDETHYIRKWEGKNLEDLKKLIDLTIHWIEMEILTNNLIEEMPE